MPEVAFTVTNESIPYKTRIDIDLHPFPDTTFTDCIMSVGDPLYPYAPNVNNLIAFFEEEMLNGLVNDTSSFQRLKATLTNLMTSLKVNFRIFIGHINLCENFVKQVTEEIAEDTAETRRYDNSAPVIVLFIACLGADQATVANTSAVWQNSRYVAMGFFDLVHIYNGRIYACRNSHLSLPSMTCLYDGAEEDYKHIVETYSLTELERTKTEIPENPLIECCQSKIDRFKSVFLKYLRKRDCAVFEENELRQKIKNILKSDGTINREMLENKSTYIFMYEDGKPCSSESECEIENPYEEKEKLADEYNSRSTIHKLFNQFDEYAYNQDISREKKDQATLKKLQALRPEEKAVMKYVHQGTTLLHAFAANGLLDSLQYCIKKGGAFLNLQGVFTGDTYLHKLVESYYIKDDTELMPFIFEAYSKEGPQLFSLLNSTGDDILSLAVFHHRLPVIQFYSHYIYPTGFADKIYGNGYNLLFQACTLYPFYSEKSFKIVQLLLSMGTDPNFIYNDKDIFHYYTFYWYPPYSAKIFKEICSYRYAYENALTDLINEYTEVLTNPSKLIKTKQQILDYSQDVESKSEDMMVPPKNKKGLENHLAMVELLQLDIEKHYRDAITIFKECKAIVNKGGKKNRQLASKSLRVLNNTRKNINTIDLRIQSKERIPEYYKAIDDFLKVVGTLFTADEKKEYRKRGIEILRNNSENAILRSQSMRDLLEEIEEVAYKRGYYQNVSNSNSYSSYNSNRYRGWGGRKRFQKTRKNLKSRRTRRKATK